MAKQQPRPPKSKTGQPERAYKAAAKKTAKPAAKKPAAKAAKVSKPAAKKAASSNKVAKAQLVDMVADKTGMTRKQSEEVVSAVLDIVIVAVKKGQSVGLPGLGILSVKATAARTGVRPGTSQKITIPAGKKVRFKPAGKLKGNL